MLWYLLKTWHGKEEELVNEIHRTVPPYLYREAFVIYNQRIWRRQGRSIVHSEPLFKGCVFLTCKETELFFGHLERVPSIARLMAVGGISVFPLTEEDAGFLERISGDDHVVRLSYVLREHVFRSHVSEKNALRKFAPGNYVPGNQGLKEYGTEKEPPCSGQPGDEQNKRQMEGADAERGSLIYMISGPLEECLEDIESIEFRKRFVKLCRRLWGEEQVIALGIILNEDMEQKMLYENLNVSVELPETYAIMEIRSDMEGKRTYTLSRGA